MTATDGDATQNEYDDGAAGGPGAPTPLIALEVIFAQSRVGQC